MFTEKHRIALLSFFIIVIGLCSSLGYLLGQPTLSTFGYATAASPLPLPFGDPRNQQEGFALDFTFIITGKNGKTTTIPAQSLSITGPHKRKIPYWYSVVTSPKGGVLRTLALHYGFCSEQKPILAQLNPIDVKEVQIQIKTKTSSQSDQWSFSIVCNS